MLMMLSCFQCRNCHSCWDMSPVAWTVLYREGCNWYQTQNIRQNAIPPTLCTTQTMLSGDLLVKRVGKSCQPKAELCLPCLNLWFSAVVIEYLAVLNFRPYSSSIFSENSGVIINILSISEQKNGMLKFWEKLIPKTGLGRRVRQKMEIVFLIGTS